MLKSLRSLQLAMALLFVLSMLVILLVSSDSIDSSFAFWALTTSSLVVLIRVLFTTYRTAPKSIGFFHILIGMTVISWIAYGFTEFQNLYSLNIEAILFTIAQNYLGLFLLVIFAGLLIGSTRGQKGGGWADLLVRHGQSVHMATIIFIVGIYFALTSYGFSLGMVMSGTGGAMNEVSAGSSALMQLLMPLKEIVSLIGFILFLGQDTQRKKIGILIIVVQIPLYFLAGRRGLLGFMLLGGLLWFLVRGIGLARLLAFSGILIFIIVVSGPLFLMVRSDAQRAGVASVESGARVGILRESISRGMDDLRSNSVISDKYLDNIENRAGFFSWTTTIQDSVSNGWATRGGEVAFQALVEVIPRFLFPGKLDYLGELRVEQQIQVWFNMPIEDGASTILGYAIADGGWIGVVIYFSLIGALYGLLFRFMMNAKFPLSSFWAAATLFGLCFAIELDLVSIFVTVRMFVIVAMLDKFSGSIFRTNADSKRRNIIVPNSKSSDARGGH